MIILRKIVLDKQRFFRVPFNRDVELCDKTTHSPLLPRTRGTEGSVASRGECGPGKVSWVLQREDP